MARRRITESTRPGVTGVNPDITVAVSVIVEPALADVSASSPFVNASGRPAVETKINSELGSCSLPYPIPAPPSEPEAL